MRIGVFGGTFDPVHLGHLILAEQAREQAKLTEVRFIPAARPPHKASQSVAPFAQRAEMLRLAVAGNPAFLVDELEKDRPGPSYTVDTLEELHQRFPEAQLILLIGADTLVDLPHWRAPERIVQLAELLVMLRTHDALPNPSPAQIPLPPGARIAWIQTPLIGIASHLLRQRVGSGQSIRYLVPRAVDCYIHAHHLYGAGSSRRPSSS